jgi:hypothetical protein
MERTEGSVAAKMAAKSSSSDDAVSVEEVVEIKEEERSTGWYA